MPTDIALSGEVLADLVGSMVATGICIHFWPLSMPNIPCNLSRF